jgi:hypothetical protein
MLNMRNNFARRNFEGWNTCRIYFGCAGEARQCHRRPRKAIIVIGWEGGGVFIVIKLCDLLLFSGNGNCVVGLLAVLKT